MTQTSLNYVANHFKLITHAMTKLDRKGNILLTIRHFLLQ